MFFFFFFLILVFHFIIYVDAFESYTTSDWLNTLATEPPVFFNPFPNKSWFLRVCNTSLLKTQRGKGKLLETSNFSFSHSVFYPFEEPPAIFIKFKIVICKLFLFGLVKKIVVWEWVKRKKNFIILH